MKEDKLGQPNVDIKNTTAVKCENCGCEVFEQAMMFREVSPIYTGTGKKGIIPITVFACNQCGHVNSQFIPEELQ